MALIEIDVETLLTIIFLIEVWTTVLFLVSFQPFKFYHQQHLSRASRALTTLIEMMGDLGQLQLIRQSISYQLSSTANFDSKLLVTSLKTFNSLAVEQFSKSQKAGESRLLYELGFFLNNCGLTEPLQQVSLLNLLLIRLENKLWIL